MIIKKNILFFCCIFYFLCTHASIYLSVFYVENAKTKTSKYKNEDDIRKYLSQLKQAKIASGYWQFSVDTFYCSTDTCYANIFVGKKYQIQHNIFDGKKIDANNIENINNIPEKILLNAENIGYPFANVVLDSFYFDKDTFKVEYKTNSNNLIIVDSFINHGNAKISKSFIENYIGIRSGKPYNESKVINIDKQLNKLPYTELTQPTGINFRIDKADIHLYLNKRKVNKFDFIIGFLPNNAITGKFLITGEARIHLQNAFKRGEELYFEWVRLKPSQQRLNIRFVYPYLFKTPLGISTSFALEKRDSASLDLLLNVGLPYFIKTNNYFKGYYKYAQTIILQTDTLFVKNNKKLPNNLDATYNLYGIEAYFENLDYLFNPRKGFDIKVATTLGVKKIKANNQIITLQSADNFNFNSLYDSINKKSLKADLSWLANYYLPIGKRSVFKFSNRGGSVFNKNLLRNELVRIGGNKILRGFDEESIYVSTYVLSTLEYRFILQRNSYFAVFYDFAYTRAKFNNELTQNFPIGFGLGINIETKIGIFGLSYALGHQKTNPINFRNSKIHFGYVVQF
jgi:outer membrane translocation and assembly module TamA